MAKKLYVGNLPYKFTDENLSEIFSQCGTVESAKVIVDRESGRSKGFGFVEMSTDEEAQAAIAKWNGCDIEGRALNVNEARPMVPRESRDGFGGGRSTPRPGGGGFRDRGGGRGDRGGGRERY